MMKLTKDEQVLYDFFITFGKAHDSVDYPLVLLGTWMNYDKDTSDFVLYPSKDKVIDAYCHMGTVDKPLFLAIKELKGWK